MRGNAKAVDFIDGFSWSECRDLNPGPLAPEADNKNAVTTDTSREIEN